MGSILNTVPTSGRTFRAPFLAVLVLLTPLPLLGLNFGQNKVRYHTDHHWKVFETKHFEIYYYQDCEFLARVATQYAENAFVKTCQAFDYVPSAKIPVFIYGTGLEFQETNITPEILGEGVGGFTEVFKNRISVPFDGSYHEFEKVLHHELTHAFQYDLIYGEGWRSVNLFKAVFVPTWMMEGMAEWNAQHLDGVGEMVLRDGILNDQVMPLNLLESFEHFEQVYLTYKESQSILDYVTQLYGGDKVVQLFKKMAANQPPDEAIKSTLGVKMGELYENWRFYMKSQAWARINGMPAPERYGEVLERETTKSAVSPDGSQLAYLKRGELGLIALPTRKKTVLVHKYFKTDGSGAAWSPDGKFLAFSAARDGRYNLYTMDLATRKIEEHVVPHMPVIYSPCWSPDQKYVVFSGFNYTNVDLYRMRVSDGHLDQLTNNLTTKSWASYSSDGKTLYYLCEDSGETTLQGLALDANGIPAGNPVIIGKDLGTLSSLRVTKDGFLITSNRGKRIFNLYRMDLSGDHLTQLTNTYTDVLSASVDPEGKTFYAAIYQRGKESLYVFPAEKLEDIIQPVLDLAYLGNSFTGASKVIPAADLKNLPTPVERVSNFDKGEPEIVTSHKPPSRIPTPVPHLEVAEASNLVQIQWPVTVEGADESVESFRIYRSTEPGGLFSYLGNTLNGRQGKYADYDVKDGNDYFYYVTACNKLGESGPSPIVEAHPSYSISSSDYQMKVTPDILLLLAGYDSTVGFVGGGLVEMSDYLGDHTLGILGDTVPGVETGVQADYEFSQWRTTVDLDYFYYQNFFNIYDLQSGSIVNQYRNNENGLQLNFSYPLNQNTRFEYGIGTQRFLGTPLYLQFNEGISNYSQTSTNWSIANYYRLSFVQDERTATQFWPSGGYAFNLTLLHALPVLDYNVSFANIMLETQYYQDFAFLNHLIWANRFIGMTSQGPNPQQFFIADDVPFEAYFTAIRGYGNSTYFGSNLAEINTELRYPLATNMNFIVNPLSFLMIKDVELAGFMDFGLLSNQIQDLTGGTFLASIGTGLRFYTFLYQRALVMLRFDVGWQLDQPVPPTFHFNLAPMF